MKQKPQTPRRAGSGRSTQLQALLQQAMTAFGGGRVQEALALAETALTKAPGNPELLNLAAACANNQGDAAKAEAYLRRAIAGTPQSAELHNNLGNVLKSTKNNAAAEGCYRRALAIRPDFADAHNNLGVTLKSLARFSEAEHCYRQAVAINPGFAEAHNNLGVMLVKLGRFADAIASYRLALQCRPDWAAAHSNLLFAMNYLPGATAADCLAEARRFGRAAALKSRPYSHWRYAAPTQGLRVGLVSGDLRRHPVGYFLENVLGGLANGRLELFAYLTQYDTDDLSERLKPHFSAWRSLAGKNDATAAALIHDDGLHILLDLSGHTAHNRLPVFAWRPAPVQVSWLGYFATTGLAEMDYLLADPVSVPEASSVNFTESIWYLPDTRLCFTPPENPQPDNGPLPAQQNGFITFGCFQRRAKLNPEVLAVWRQILQALPLARLRLQNEELNDPPIRAELQQQLVEAGIPLERVSLMAAMPRADYLRSLAEVDMILDTFPFTGGATTCEALWMGTPTLTLAGDALVARQGASLLACAGLTDWIAGDQADYVAKALAHAGNLQALVVLRAELRAKVMATPLFDGKCFAANLEQALWDMWEHGLDRRGGLPSCYP